MDQALANALKRKAELEKELGEINRFLTLYDRFTAGTEPVGSDVSISGPGATYVITARTGRGKSRGRPADFAEIMERVLRDISRPLTRTELVDALEQRDVKIPSDDKARYLGTILWRNRNRFINIPNQGYWLKSVPNAIANYKPGDIEDERFGDDEDSAAGAITDRRKTTT